MWEKQGTERENKSHHKLKVVHETRIRQVRLVDRGPTDKKKGEHGPKKSTLKRSYRGKKRRI